MEEKSKEDILEETINKRALKIGRKVLDEMYLHGENKVEVSIRKSDIFYWSIVDVGVHSVTGLFRDEIKFIKEEGLSEMSYKDFEIKKVVEK
jgi:hypothetical protein